MIIAIQIVLVSLASVCRGGRNYGVPIKNGVNRFEKSFKNHDLNKRLVNPRIDPGSVNRVKRDTDHRYDRRVIDEQDPTDIDIKVDTNQITVHTADHQLSINLLGKCRVHV